MKRHTEPQIVFALQQAQESASVTEICRKIGVAEQTEYWWKRRCAGWGISEIRRLHQLEEENRRLKQSLADLALDSAMLQDVLPGEV